MPDKANYLVSLFLYNLAIWFYGIAIRIAAPFQPKAKLWVQGRKDLINRISQAVKPGDKWIWFHAASLGEFEQGRPLIELLKARHPQYRIILTFFSPSGYMVRKDYAYADLVTYMPLDTPGNARAFVDVLQPMLAVFVKYEIWYHHLAVLRNSGTPAILISAQFRPGQLYFQRWGAFLKRELEALAQIFVTSSKVAGLLSKEGFSNVAIAGDTRIDRVIQNSENHADFTWLREYLGNRELLVAGSTWPGDEAVLRPVLEDSRYAIIIAPHEIPLSRIKSLVESIPGVVLTLSEIRAGVRGPCNCVVVDTIGELSSIYHLASIAFVGGGFNSGIHNILEPAAYCIPVIFGPNFARFEEAQQLIDLGCAASVSDDSEMSRTLEHYSKPVVRAEVEAALDAFLRMHSGATERIYAYIRGHNILLHASGGGLPG